MIFFFIGLFMLFFAHNFPILKNGKNRIQFILFITIPLFVYSYSSHKEWRFSFKKINFNKITIRFLTVVYPFFPIISAIPMVLLTKLNFRKILKCFLIVIFIVNTCLFVNVCLARMAVINSIDYLVKETSLEKLLYVSGCFQTPYFSHIHK